jgi:hypothetical protein
MEQVVKSKVNLGLPFMVPDLVYKFQMICLREKYALLVKFNKKKRKMFKIG